RGYLPHSTHNWWFDADEADAFEMFDLDGFYSNRYYRADHVHRLVVEVIVTALLAVVRDTLGRDVHSVLDLGCGAGQFTKAFLDGGIDTTAVEGSKAGVARAVQRGVPGSRLLRHDLRLPLRLERRFDMVMCTEIAEHIEPPFSSQLIHTISEHSDVCWFSSEPPGTNQDHLHHCNEQPDVFWINLFRFYGFQALPISIDVQLQEGSTVEQFCREQAVLRGRYVFIRSEEDLSGQQAAVLVSADETGALSACTVTT
ncbi:MAG: class I SAM-dependent methyltransferase, partial [Candidatus Poribacteria bacterium]